MLIFIRSLIFNICFYGYTTICCLIFVPSLFLSRNAIMGIIRFYLSGIALLEKYIIGLTFEIRGQEHLPKEGTYIVAAKHQSTYETFKLHSLFDDPTIVLKIELMRIPIFSTFLKKIDVIPIDRKNKEQSMKSIIDGAARMKKSNRPIIIFPQGTRVAPHHSARDKSYKGGIAKMYGYTGLSIVPLALNTGMFWPRKSFLKRPGRVIFEFLPPIEPGLQEKQVMRALEDRLEQASIRLMHEAKSQNPTLKDVAVVPQS